MRAPVLLTVAAVAVALALPACAQKIVRLPQPPAFVAAPPDAGPRRPDPELALRYRVEGQRAFELRLYDEAIRQWSAAVALDPRTEYVFALGLAYARRGERDDAPPDLFRARELFVSVLRARPGDRDAIAGIKEVEAAEKIFNRTPELTPR